ncbi:uncharacterized protein LOC122503727 [Leptopilina heterotoma]|uniref:uncharacterized protein LOC122503727 n=1 Tax=Leptopilina heterotoma TaxID=63436 RepID=UPI001CA968FD|nr:uncharacterized protein LOC122503727 [Leptopilina heterotoma]
MKFNIIFGSILFIFTIFLINNVHGKFNLDGLKKMVKPFKAPCIEQSGVSPDLIDEVNKGNFVDDPQLKCYLMCLFQKLKTIKGGKIVTSSMKSQIQALVEDNLASRMLQLIEACEHFTIHEDLCEASFAYCKCSYQFDSSKEINCQDNEEKMDGAFDQCLKEYDLTDVNLTCFNSCIAVKAGIAGVNCQMDDMPESMKAVMDSCLNKFDVSKDEYITAVKNNDYSINAKNRCLRECFMSESGVMKDGEIKVDKLKELMVGYNPSVTEADIESTHVKCLAQEEGQKMRADHDFAKKRLRCYSACFMKKTNEMNENNQLNMNTISSIEHTLYPEKADEMMKVNCIPHPPPPMTEEMKKNMDECRTELGISMEEERELHRNHDFKNEKLRCMPACLMKKDGVRKARRMIVNWLTLSCIVPTSALRMQKTKVKIHISLGSFISRRTFFMMNSQLFMLIAFIGFCGFKNVQSGMTMDQVENMAKGMRKSCLSKVPIDTQVALNVRKGEFPDDPTFKCYLRCIAKMSKAIKGGKIDEAVILASVALMPVNAERALIAAKKCTSITADDECELAYQYVKCNYEADPEIFFFP